MKNNKILGKKESIFVIIALSIINILFLVQFIINFADITNIVNLLKLDDPTLNIKNFDVYKIVLIFMLVFCIISFILSFIFLTLRNRTAKSAILIVNVTLLVLIYAFYFTIKFSNGNMFSLFAGVAGDYSSIIFNDYLISEGVSLLISVGISFVNSILSFNLSNQIFGKNRENKNEIDENKSVAELDLENGIEKLKSQIRIKNLEKEYLKLKSELDEDTQE